MYKFYKRHLEKCQKPADPLSMLLRNHFTNRSIGTTHLHPTRKRHYALHLLFPSLGARLRLCFTGNDGVPLPELPAVVGGEYLLE
jgi:hypothetical protein